DGIRDFHVTGVQTCALPIYGEQALRMVGGGGWGPGCGRCDPPGEELAQLRVTLAKAGRECRIREGERFELRHDPHSPDAERRRQIGRASCRERRAGARMATV